MKTQGIFIAHPETVEQVNALQAFTQALKIRFEISREEGYHPDFVEKVLESRQQVKDGKVTRVKKENLKEFLGL
jgi:transcription elongation factor